MNKLVTKKMNEMLEVFESLPNCWIEQDEGDRLMIASNKPVSWNESDEKVKFKIGYITPHKASLGLYIDFPHGFLDLDRVEAVMNPEETLYYYPPGEKAPTVKSWWRFRSDEKFDSIHMVLRKIELEMYDFSRDDWRQLMEEITEVHT